MKWDQRDYEYLNGNQRERISAQIARVGMVKKCRMKNGRFMDYPKAVSVYVDRTATVI